jgi:hypothetical protein
MLPRFVALIALATFAASCSREKGAPVEVGAIAVGGVYAHPDGAAFTLSKVIVADEDRVHVRLYREVFDSVPADARTSTLTVLAPHSAIERAGFLRDQPRLVGVEPVRREELRDYEARDDRPRDGSRTSRSQESDDRYRCTVLHDKSACCSGDFDLSLACCGDPTSVACQYPRERPRK